MVLPGTVAMPVLLLLPRLHRRTACANTQKFWKTCRQTQLAAYSCREES